MFVLFVAAFHVCLHEPEDLPYSFIVECVEFCLLLLRESNCFHSVHPVYPYDSVVHQQFLEWKRFREDEKVDTLTENSASVEIFA